MSDPKIPTPPPGDFLTAEQIVEFGELQKKNIRYDTPEGETPICAYCGKETTMRAYTNLDMKRSWPPCCMSADCLDKWDSVPMADLK